MESQKVAVLGLGYVGCVTAACLAHLGHKVRGIDPDERKVQSVREGEAPFYEPGLAEIVRAGLDGGRLTASVAPADGLGDADIALICVGTPSERNGNLGLAQLRKVAGDLERELQTRDPGLEPLVVAVRSTVFPGTCEELVAECLSGSRTAVVANPEFLREGSAVRDFLEPSLVVVGGNEPWAVERVASLYSGLRVTPCRVSLRTAEMIKYACNAFHAVKIGFANEVGTLCAALGISGREVMDTLCSDATLNISRAYLKPGFAFGGSCLPKDLRALEWRGSRLDLKLPLVASVLPSNAAHLERAIHAVLDLKAARLGVFGLSFKENTDDLRESPVVSLLEQLIGKGRDVRVFDPHIRLDAIYGSNQRFVMAAIPHIGRLLEPSLETLLGWAQQIVITQRPAPEYRERIRASGAAVLDLAGANE